jgi:hypothetical protein
MEKPKIKVTIRRKDFYTHDTIAIRSNQEGWENMEILEDLTEKINNYDNEERKGVIVCWNKKDHNIEILNYSE